MTDDWRIWNQDNAYGDLLYKRATGDLAEMESSKALCKIISPFYENRMKVLDIGCGAGHYLRSLRLRIDEDINYTGVDATEYYVELARKAFGDAARFLRGDIYNLQFKDNSFDIVICNNVILHLPPPPIKPISELIRVSSKYIVIRTVFGERNYIIKELRSSDEEIQGLPIREGNLIDSEGKPLTYNYFNMYTEPYFRDIVADINEIIGMKIVRDDYWNSFNNTAVGGETATKVIGGKQISGNLLLDWRFIVLSKK